MALSLILPLVVVAVILHRYFRKRSLPLPPGPPPEPIIGNLRQIPVKSSWLKYVEWSKTYHSDVIAFKALGKRFIILNSIQATMDLLELRGATYSDRDHNVMVQDLIGSTSMATLSYNELFRLHRKVMNVALNPTAARDFYPVQEKEAFALMNRLLKFPDKWNSQIRRAASSTILTMTYGHEVTTDDDHLVALSERVMRLVTRAAIPTSYLVNLIPALKYIPDWVPGINFKLVAWEGRKLREDIREVPLKMVYDQMAAGNYSCYAARLLESKGDISGDPDLDEELIKETSASMHAAGADTTTAAVTGFILAIVLHPEVQVKAQAEIDTVIGGGRLPTFEDQDSLPYLRMVLAECLRWNPIAQFPIPHVARTDDVYNGMWIPKGSLVMANIWAIMHDEKMYPEPERFWPERFDGRFPNARQPRNMAFGFNRRICPGRHLALNSFFIIAANLLAVYNISKARDEYGNEIEPIVDYSEGSPKLFKCMITPRSDAAVALIRSTAAMHA